MAEQQEPGTRTLHTCYNYDFAYPPATNTVKEAMRMKKAVRKFLEAVLLMRTQEQVET